MEEKKINKKIIFSVCSVILIVFVLIGVTYAYFTASSSSNLNTITTRNLTMVFNEGQLVRSTNSIPILDSEIETSASELPFSVTNTGDQHMNLTISLTDITISEELKDEDFRWALYNSNNGVMLSTGTFKDIGDATSLTIYRDTIIDAANPDITNNYILRIWIHEDNTNQNYMQGKSFSAKLTVDGDAVEYTPESCFTVRNYVSSGVEIEDYDESCGTDVVIPKTINGKKVVSIAGYYEYYWVPDDEGNDDYAECPIVEGAFQDKGITSIIIPNTVINIGQDVIGDCSENYDEFDIEHITIPEGVKKIEEFSVNTIFIPDTVTYASDVDAQNVISPCRETYLGKIRYDRACSVVEDDDEGYY